MERGKSWAGEQPLALSPRWEAGKRWSLGRPGACEEDSEVEAPPASQGEGGSISFMGAGRAERPTQTAVESKKFQQRRGERQQQDIQENRLGFPRRMEWPDGRLNHLHAEEGMIAVQNEGMFWSMSL